jgi:CheY-like chemotaxis protein
MNTHASLSILLAEDDEADVMLLQRAFKDVSLVNPLHVANDGQAAIDFLTQLRSRPDERLPGLAILDLKMPRRSGIQVVEWMRAQPVIRTIPALIFSSSANRSDIEAAYDAGASAYLIKPPSIAERTELARFLKDWLRLVQSPSAALESFKAAQGHRAPV